MKDPIDNITNNLFQWLLSNHQEVKDLMIFIQDY